MFINPNKKQLYIFGAAIVGLVILKIIEKSQVGSREVSSNSRFAVTAGLYALSALVIFMIPRIIRAPLFVKIVSWVVVFFLLWAAVVAAYDATTGSPNDYMPLPPRGVNQDGPVPPPLPQNFK